MKDAHYLCAILLRQMHLHTFWIINEFNARTLHLWVSNRQKIWKTVEARTWSFIIILRSCERRSCVSPNKIIIIHLKWTNFIHWNQLFRLMMLKSKLMMFEWHCWCNLFADLVVVIVFFFLFLFSHLFFPLPVAKINTITIQKREEKIYMKNKKQT